MVIGWVRGVRSEGGEGGGLAVGCLFVCLQCADSGVLEPPLAPRIQPVHPKTPKKEPLLSLHQYRPIDTALSKLQPELYRHQPPSLPSPHMLYIHPQTEERNYPLPSPSPVACSSSHPKVILRTSQTNHLSAIDYLPSPLSLPPRPPHHFTPKPQFSRCLNILQAALSHGLTSQQTQTPSEHLADIIPRLCNSVSPHPSLTDTPSLGPHWIRITVSSQASIPPSQVFCRCFGRLAPFAICGTTNGRLASRRIWAVDN